jgi:hypothetical protein
MPRRAHSKSADFRWISEMAVGIVYWRLAFRLPNTDPGTPSDRAAYAPPDAPPSGSRKALGSGAGA